jgi:hypothetical protein
MSIVYILAGVAILIIAFLSGYNLAKRQESDRYQELGGESNSLEPIFAMLDREWKYTDKLGKPFSHEK